MNIFDRISGENSPSRKSAFFVLASVIVLVLVFGAGFFIGSNSDSPAIEVTGIDNKEPPTLDPNVKNVDFAQFWDVWSRLQEKFVDPSKMDKEKMVYGAISGLVNSLDDPYTVFFPPQEAKTFEDDIRGSFGGIGAEIGMQKGILTVVAPLKNSPAEKAGLQAKDMILKIDGKDTAKMTVDEAVRNIRGERGTQVKLLVFRDSFEVPKEIAITRDTIRIPIVKHESKGNGIYYIALYNFNEQSGNEFRRALQGFFGSGDKKLILDLRNNPGGYLNLAVDIGSFFTPPGAVIVQEEYRDGTKDVYRSAGYNLLKDVPVVVLVNAGSASASEILAGALRDLNHTQLVGEKTFGKGSVQELVNLPNKASLKVTIAQWVTPNGTVINGNGLEPDVAVKIPEKPEEGKDYYLDKALEILKSK